MPDPHVGKDASGPSEQGDIAHLKIKLEIAMEALHEIANTANADNPMAISKPCCQRFDLVAHDAIDRIDKLG